MIPDEFHPYPPANSRWGVPWLCEHCYGPISRIGRYIRHRPRGADVSAYYHRTCAAEVFPHIRQWIEKGD